ncbi:hypothetical protein GEMRC1_010599 [Eukaryota sp. GEM-RC1]
MVLEGKRSQGIGVLLPRLPPASQMKEAIFNLDETKLNLDSISMVQLNLPTPDEIMAIKAAIEDPSAILDKPEEWCLAVSKIPKIQQRLNAWIFKYEFGSVLEDAMISIKNLADATEAVSKSRGLRSLLGMILTIGNFVNCGTSRGNAMGFEFAFLVKAGDLKDSDNKKTMLQYATEFILEKGPFHIVEELAPVKNAVRVSFGDLDKTANELKAKYNSAQKAVDEIIQISNPNDIFVEKMKPFMERCAREMKMMEDELEKERKKFRDLLKFLGYLDKAILKMEPSEWFPEIVEVCQKIAQFIPKKVEKKEKKKEEYG